MTGAIVRVLLLGAAAAGAAAAAAAAGVGVGVGAHSRRRQILPPLSSPSSLASKETPSSPPSSSSSSSPQKQQQQQQQQQHQQQEQLRAKSFAEREKQQYDDDLYNVVSGGDRINHPGTEYDGSSSSSNNNDNNSDDDDYGGMDDYDRRRPYKEDKDREEEEGPPIVVVNDDLDDDDDEKKKREEEQNGTEALRIMKKKEKESPPAAAAASTPSASRTMKSEEYTIPTSSPSSSTTKIIMSGSWRRPSPTTKTTDGTNGSSSAAAAAAAGPLQSPVVSSTETITSSTTTTTTTTKAQETQTQIMQEEVQEEVRISHLEDQISILQTKCEALESQSILVSVQQLDWFVRLTSNTLWGLTLVGYAKVCGCALRWWDDEKRQVTTTSTSRSSVSSSQRDRNINQNNNDLWAAYHNNATTFDDTDVDHVTVTLKDGATAASDEPISSSNSTRSSPSSSSSSTSSWLTLFSSDDLMFVGIQLGMVALPLGYNYLTCGSFRRRLQVFSTAFVVIGRIRLCRWREQHFVQQQQPAPSRQPQTHRTTDSSAIAANNTIPRYGESCTNDGIWESNYEISARFLWLSVSRLRGLWTKSAQYLSSRADFMPVSYIRELSKLQDSAPATPWHEIEHLMSPKLREAIVDVDTTPIASASIGQVHVATIKIDDDNDGDDDENKQSKPRKVVIKIQHPHARTLMTEDFWSLMVICRVVGWLEPDYKFMEILMREWAVEARKEFDFTNEAYHLDLARSALEGWRSKHPTSVDGGVGYTTVGNKTVPFQVEVPEPLKQFSNDRVLVMEYCDGCRVDDFQQLSKWNMPRRHVMDALSQTFAYFMYQSPIFNGDPHVSLGVILFLCSMIVHKSTGMPCI